LQDEIFNKRPEQLSVQQFVELTNMVEKELVLMNSQQH
jgi:16S rRNA (adenine1518-N6/adenine1519-N6)-dimethyltransferase